MEYILWIIAISCGFLIGRFTAPQEKTKYDNQLESQNQALQEDVAYYKKLTRKLVEENKQLRKNV
jgi:hypothetical protein